MAGKEFPLSIVLRTDDKATAGLQKLQRQLEPIEKKLAAIGKQATQVGKKLTTNLSLPIVAIGAASVKAMSDFQDGMASVETLIDSNTESIDDMGKSVLAIGKRTPVELSKLQEALYGIRSAGTPAADAMAVLEKSAQLGVAGLGSTAEASDLVTSSLNAFQLQGEDAAKVYDTIFKTVKNGKTDIAALAQGFGSVAGTVAATGTPLDEYLASVAALTTTGLPASQAHTQMKAVISGLTRETKESSKVFRKLGAKDFKDLIAQSGGMVPALQAISEELGGNEAKILKLVGSTEAMGAMNGLVGGQNKAFTDTLADMREGANAVDEAFQKKNKTLKASSQRTKNALTSVGVSIGTILAPALESLAEKLEEATVWWDGLDAGTKVMIVDFAKFVAVVGPSLMIFGKLVSTVSMIATVTRTLSAAIWVATGAMKAFALANPFVALGIAAVATAALIYEHWDGIKEFIEGIVRGIKEAADTVRDVKAYLTGDATSADKDREAARNAKIKADFERSTIDLRLRGQDKITADMDARWAALEAEKGMGAPALGADGGASLGGQGGKGGAGANGQLEIRITGETKGVRANLRGAENIDVNIGDQMGVD